MSRSLSVLMPVLNEESSIADAIGSVLNQAGCDQEILVVDGRSVDRTREIVADLARSDPRIRLLDNAAVIIPAGLNAGLAAARHEFVARVDGHAEISADYLARALDRLAADPSLAGIGGRRRGVARTRVGRAIAAVMSSPFGVGNSINHYAEEYQLTDHASFGVYRTAAARQVGGWDVALPVNEDVDFDHRLRLAGHRIAYDPEMIINWRVRETVATLFQQYRRYGRGKAAMVRKNGRRAVRSRHLAAPALVIGVVLSVVTAPWVPALLIMPGGYLAGIVVVSVVTWCRSAERADVAAAALPAAFVATHTGWGLGFLEGLLFKRSPAVASGDSRSRAAAV
ncbi:glycosyltransferase [Microlunatus soli]|uniref:Glycosyl transferase family 2 n=1 Tax=Microlunatus soli TaxID=630515 RepID=A0A1H1WF06_9ACTN|nr:glycosyltransferase [Microlunatus soli]SDS94946.1 Glycosyl transferase family 2 [Microlunatus soli]